jgi:glucosamine-6-phosphate deaminase
VRVVIESTAEIVERAAERVAATLRARPRAVLGLAAGRTMEPVYAALGRRHREQGLSLAGARAFLLDEYLGVAADDPRSLRFAVMRALVEGTDLSPEALASPDGLAEAPEAEAARYEAAIRAAGGVDLQLLGIGTNGHLGFNEPGAALLGPCHVHPLAAETLEAQRAALAAGGAEPPRAALTMGLGTLLAARACLLVATGASKAHPVAAAVEGPLTAMVPASVLQLHPDATLLLDEAAAEALHRPDPWREDEEVARELELERGR